MPSFWLVKSKLFLFSVFLKLDKSFQEYIYYSKPSKSSGPLFIGVVCSVGQLRYQWLWILNVISDFGFLGWELWRGSSIVFTCIKRTGEGCVQMVQGLRGMYLLDVISSVLNILWVEIHSTSRKRKEIFYSTLYAWICSIWFFLLLSAHRSRKFSVIFLKQFFYSYFFYTDILY